MASDASSRQLNLLFPQWQGADRFELYEGARLLCESLAGLIAFERVPTTLTYSLVTRRQILGYDQIDAQMAHACSIVDSHEPERVLTIGGDCGVELAPVSYLNRKYGSDMAVVWIDAHGDLNTPRSSPSGRFHGMPLRTLLGEGDERICGRLFSTLLPEQVILVGARDFDGPEIDLIKHHDIPVVTAGEVNDGGSTVVAESLRNRGRSKLYVHLDLDSADPNDFPHVPVPAVDGIAWNRLADLIGGLDDEFEVVGCSVLEFLPGPNGPEEAAKIVRLLESINVFPPVFP